MTTPAVPATTASFTTTGSDFSGWDDDVRSDANDGSEVEYGLPASNVDAPSEDEARRRGTNRQVGGAAVVAGIAGALLMGPVLGLAAAGGAAAVAARNGGRAGDVARASGDAVTNTGQRIRRFDRRHHVTSRAGEGIARGAKWMADKTKIKNNNGHHHHRNAEDNLTA